MENYGYEITYSGKFKKDFKRYERRPRELKAFSELLDIISLYGASGVPERMKPHRLTGKYRGMWECHIFPDFLLIWNQGENPANFIHLIRLGSHSELF